MGEMASTGLEGVLPGGFNASLETPKDPAALAKLKEACAAAYKDHPNSCSHAVNAIVRTVLGMSEQAWPQRQANDLVAFLTQSTDWTEVTLDRAYELALQGVPVVGGKAETGTNGHVIIVYPGLRKPRGGYGYTDKTGAAKTVAVKGSYPLALSTSLGSWPGARSNGDKTVWDPWGKDASFELVKFWAPAKSASGKPDVSAMLRKGGMRYG